MAAETRLGILLSLKDNASGAVRKFGSNMDRMSQQARTAGLVLGGVGAAGLLMAKQFVGAAEQFTSAQALVRSAVERTGEQWEDNQGRIAAVTDEMERNTNFSRTEQMNALQQMIAGLGSTNEALDKHQTLLDFATATQRNLTSAVQVYLPFVKGETNTLSALGIRVDATATKQERLRIVQEATAGAARDGADASAQLANAKQRIAETIGLGLLPLLQPLASGLQDVASWMSENEDAAKRLGLVLGIGAAGATVGGSLLLFLSIVPNVIAGFGKMSAGLGLLRIAWIKALLPVLAFVAAAEGATRAANAIDEAIAKSLGRRESPVATPLDLVGEAIAKIDRSLDGVIPSLDSASGEFAALEEQAKKLTRTVDPGVTNAYSNFTESVQKAESGSDDLSGAWSRALGAAYKLGLDLERVHATMERVAQTTGDQDVAWQMIARTLQGEVRNGLNETIVGMLGLEAQSENTKSSVDRLKASYVSLSSALGNLGMAEAGAVGAGPSGFSQIEALKEQGFSTREAVRRVNNSIKDAAIGTLGDREYLASGGTSVQVFIGDRELRDIVVQQTNDGLGAEARREEQVRG